MYSKKPLLHQRQRAHRPGQLRSVSVDVTPACNMSCPHCYAETFRNSTPVDIEVLSAAMKELHDLGVFHWILQGGEPILDTERLETILRGCCPEESYITVVSNGWAMTPDRIRWLKELKVDKIAFSMDSGVPHEHDAGRRAGSHERVREAVEHVLAAGLFSSISITITHDSLYSEGFTRALEFASSRDIRVDIQVAEPVGKWDGEKGVLIRPEDAAYLKRLQMELPPLSNGQRAVHRDIFSGDRDHCPAATEFMAISSDGHVLPCNFLQYSMGRIGETPIAEMRRVLIASPWFDGSHSVCICDEDRFIPWKPRIKLVVGNIEGSVPEFCGQNPGVRFSLVHFDCDLYKPTKAALEALWPRIQRGGVVLFDEYGMPEWPGETTAVDELLDRHPDVRLRTFDWTNVPAAFFIKP